MIETLLGGLLGGAFRLAPEVLKWLDRKGERGHELAMLALYRNGRQADALDHFAAYRELLDEELGLEPGAPLRELQRRILQQDAVLEVVPDDQASSGLPVARG